MVHALMYSNRYEVDLGPHVFPSQKYRLIKESLIHNASWTPQDFIEPPKATPEELLLAHTKEYIEKVSALSLSSDDIARLEIPLTREIAEASFLCCAGTILACGHALEQGVGLHNGGGFHHAFPDHGEGFCVFNDIAVGIRAVQKAGKIKRAMVIDCDLHQGNGTAAIFSDDPSVFTFSIHQADIYPFVKPPSTLDIALNAGTGDEEYLRLLAAHLPKSIEKHKPGLLVYQAGADPYMHDQLGGLQLTLEGLARRDAFIYGLAKKYSVPVAVTLGGGYAARIEDTVAIHARTFTIFSGL